MIFVAAGLDGVSQQTVTVKPDFGKEAIRPVDGSGLDVGDRVTLGIRLEHCSLADSGHGIVARNGRRG
ncbi:hypothetical protein [Thalassospira alkalitolerans]|uniref:hypothetical protein n=1 Tax=Thalassospira alkalitolerans TaxID=1293890 RepID=UPI003AA90C1B